MKTNRYDISLIRKYLNGELDDRAMYDLERKAQDDPILMDLMLGMEMGDEREDKEALEELDVLIRNRSEKKRERTFTPMLYWAAAASFFIAAGIAGLLLLRDKPKEDIARLSKPEFPDGRARAVKPSEKDTIKPVIQDAPLMASRTKKRITSTPSPKKTLFPETEQMASLAKSQQTGARTLDEVVVIAYGTQKKTDQTGSVSSITARDTVSMQLMGRVAGVSVQSKIKIRGSNSLIVTGRITDKKDNTPLAGVSVMVKGKNTGTATDVNGHFRLTVTDKDETLLISYIGYEAKSVKARNDSLFIALEPNLNSLNEVAVVGYGESKTGNGTLTDAQPAKGWTNFRKYLKENALAVDARGNVTISFSVAPSGTIGDVKIIKGLNAATNQKAIDLLLNGPEWVGAKDGTVKEIKLRIKFR